MGSVCCVPAKQQSHERWTGGVGPSEPTNWRMNGNYSPPLSSRWEGKAFPEDGNSLHLYRSSFSSSSRGGSSRRGNVGHPRAASGSFFSPDPSPSPSFRAHLNSISSSQICPLVDLVPLASSEAPNSSPCMTVSSSKEGCFSGALSTADSTASYGGECCPSTQAPPKQSISSSSHSFVSKFSKSCGSRESNNKNAVSSVGSSRSSDLDAGFVNGSGEIDTFGGGAAGSDWWSMVTFSELVASSRREKLRWISARNGGDGGLSSSAGLEALDAADFMTLEQIKDCGIQAAGSVSPSNDSLVCGLCSRCLSQRSPLSIHRMLGNMDLPGVGVLCCGHVFHANCLEQATCEGEQQDPPCPQCAVVRKLDVGDVVSRGLLQQSSSSHAGARNNNNNNNNKKLFRVGGKADDPAAEEGGELTIKKKASLKIFSTSQEVKQTDKAAAAKCTSKKAFAFRHSRKPSSFSQVSPDNQADDDHSSPSGHSRRGSFGW